MQRHLALPAADVIALVPDHLLDQLSTETGVDYSVKKLHGKIIFKLFLYGILSGKTISLRILASIFNSTRFKHLFSLPDEWIKHSGIADRFAHIDYRYFERIFQHLTTSSLVEDVLFDRRKISTRKIDSTIVTLSSKLLKVGRDDNPDKKTLKYTVELQHGIPVNIMLWKGQKYLSEDNALPELITQKKQQSAVNIALFDRGVQRKQTFVDLVSHQIYFVSRISTQKLRIIEQRAIAMTDTSHLTIVSDVICRFANVEGLSKESAQETFRVITGIHKDTRESISFITNVDFLEAHEVTELYRSRWEIETFFRFIKQELNFSHLLARNENGIKVVMYLTMIAAILLTIYKKKNKIVGWAVAKIMFLDELESGVMHEWHGEMSPVFDPKSNQFYANSSVP